MSVIILIDADDADVVSILQDEEILANKVFESVDVADMWLQENAKVGWCTRIVDIDD